MPEPTPGEYVRTTRERLNVTMEELAAMLGKSRVTLFRWQREGGPAWLKYALLGLLVDRSQLVRLETLGAPEIAKNRNDKSEI